MGDTNLTETDVFEAERGRLTALAYRTLGSMAEAEDAVQEAWLRFAAADRGQIRDPRAWLTTVVARICLDVLRSARVRREAYVGPWLPEPLVQRLDQEEDGPAEAAARSEEIGLAMMVVLERLTPEQRVALVLHDVFAVPFDAIAAALGTTPDAARQLATRARRAVADGAPRRRADPAEQRRAVEAFLVAARSGDMDRLLAVLAPDVVMIGDGGGIAPAGPRPIEGAVAAARFIVGLFRRAEQESIIDLEYALVNGEIGLVMEIRPLPDHTLPAPRGMQITGALRLVIAFAVENGRIVGIYDQLNPNKLTRVPPLAELRSS